MRYSRPNGLFFDGVALGVLLLLAGVGQCVLGPWFWGLYKPPLLMAVVVYFALMRPRGVASAAALLGGILADGLGSVGFPAHVLVSIGVLAFCLFWGRENLNRVPSTCAFLGTCAVFLTQVLQCVALWQGGALHETLLGLLLRFAIHIGFSFPVLWMAVWGMWLFERATGNCLPDEKKGVHFHARA